MKAITKNLKQMRRVTFLFATGSFIFSTAKAQILPLNAQYFQNRYLVNPSMAGIKEGFNINGSFRKQWSNIPGAPLTQSVTLDQQVGKVGWGVNVYNEKSGDLQRTKAVGTFAYHLPLSGKEQQLNFGVSFGVSRDRLDLSSIRNSDINDPSIARFNDRGSYLDGDFGVSYTSKGLTIEGAVPNIRSVFRKDDLNYANKPTFYSAIGYKFSLGEGMNGISLEPKGVFRGIKNYKNLWDAGVNANFANDKLCVMAMYHNTQNATVGFGVNYKSSLYFMAYYNTATSAISGYTDGDFEVNIRVNIGKKK
ncbi:PorP/SprF family type IX secretion system membrane protein [Pedobacter sp. MC2016-05]|uniref:PorP/SprF family type IX secretion system membrane protein n=1 Tax=Pedobacter sp. MC2016-05 TaxID=2994474 RepID=UPI002246A22E|nr:PorP/SprF family type IX secretion system membrane protein [Pedobacter sp. MC2016-05]MCX2474885.1 PorP/SprF family type IX secretion system membrane protein [Pedobacter sp. MC2016-05]